MSGGVLGRFFSLSCLLRFGNDDFFCFARLLDMHVYLAGVACGFINAFIKSMCLRLGNEGYSFGVYQTSWMQIL